MRSFVLYKYTSPTGSKVGSITLTNMQRVQPTGACIVCYEGLNGMPERDDYHMNLEYWQGHRPAGEADSIEWDRQRPVITHAVGTVEKSGVPSKIHWMCHGCLHKLNPETKQYYITICPLCPDKIIHRGNIEHHAEPQAVAAELDPELVTQLWRPLRYYAHPHAESYENVSNRWYQEVCQRELAARQVQEQQDKDSERLAELRAQQQREQALIDRQQQEQREDERVLEEQQRWMLRDRQRQEVHAAEQQHLQQKQEQRHMMMLQLRETQRLQLMHARQEAQRNAAARQQPHKNATVFLPWMKH